MSKGEGTQRIHVLIDHFSVYNRHAELLALNGMYADMWDEQLRAAATMDNEVNEIDEIEADEMEMSETAC